MSDETMNLDWEEIRALLTDIVKFLKNKLDLLSDEDRKIAKDLVQRTQVEIEKLPEEFYIDIEDKATTVSVTDARYVDMNAKQSVLRSKNISQKTVQSSESINLPPPLPVKNGQSPLLDKECPFKDLPAQKLPAQTKQGMLRFWRKRFGLFNVPFNVFGAVHESWLLIYRSVKDTKPFLTLDLNCHEAREEDNETTDDENASPKKKKRKKQHHFNIVQTNSSEKKCYFFTASSHEDAMHWVRFINEKGLFCDEIEEDTYMEIDYRGELKEINLHTPPALTTDCSVSLPITNDVVPEDTYYDLAVIPDNDSQLKDRHITTSLYENEEKQIDKVRLKPVIAPKPTNTVKIIRRKKWSVSDFTRPNLETFRTNDTSTRIPLFQASHNVEDDYNYLDNPKKDLDELVQTVDVTMTNVNKKPTEDEKPRVLLRNELECAD